MPELTPWKYKSLRQHYIDCGAIKPRQVLRLDAVGRAMARAHMREDREAAERGYLCEIPLEQVPEYVLAYWGV
jgi:hypothetical protein